MEHLDPLSYSRDAHGMRACHSCMRPIAACWWVDGAGLRDAERHMVGVWRVARQFWKALNECFQESIGSWGPRANPASKEKVTHASSVVIRPNCEVCHGSPGSLTARWAVAVECPYASARAVPAARPLSARTPRDARTTRGWLRGLLLGRVRRKRRWRASRSSRCWAPASAWCSERRI